jgi:hypothetical protein
VGAEARAGVEGGGMAQAYNFRKVISTRIFYGKCTRALTFENARASQLLRASYCGGVPCGCCPGGGLCTRSSLLIWLSSWLIFYTHMHVFWTVYMR